MLDYMRQHLSGADTCVAVMDRLATQSLFA